jgi:hypothetical protein
LKKRTALILFVSSWLRIIWTRKGINTVRHQNIVFHGLLKSNTPFIVVEDRPVSPGSSVLSDRTGYLPKRLAASRQNPMAGLVREIRVMIETGKVLRIFTNDLEASAQEIADLYKRRWAIELFFRWVKQTLKIGHFLGTSENTVRIQITVALIAFLLLRLAHDANRIVTSPLAFARLLRTNLMHRRVIAELLQATPPPRATTVQIKLRTTCNSCSATAQPYSRWRRHGERGMTSTGRARQPRVRPAHDKWVTN